MNRRPLRNRSGHTAQHHEISVNRPAERELTLHSSGGILHNVEAQANVDQRALDSSAVSREFVDGVPRILVLSKARTILDAFSEGDSELTLQALTTRSGIPPTTCLRLVRNLVHEGFLERTGDRYRMGMSIVRWAAYALDGRDLVVSARPILEQLRDETGESAHLCVRQGGFRVMVAVAESRHSVLRLLRVGEVVPLHVGSTGKVFLAFDDAAPIPDVASLVAYTAQTRVDLELLKADVEKIRALGYAMSFEERDVGAVGITAPIFDHRRSMVGAIGLSGPIQRLDLRRANDLVPSVCAAGRSISERLTYARGSRWPTESREDSPVSICNGQERKRAGE